MLEYYTKYEKCPLVDTNSKLDVPMETPLKLTLTEIGGVIATFMAILLLHTSAISLIIAFILSPIVGYLLYKYRKCFPRKTYTHFFWTTGFLENKNVPNFFERKKEKGVVKIFKSFFKKKIRYRVFGP